MKTMEEHAASAMAHRACCGTEHDPLNGKLHGYCVVCGVEWPCATAKHYLIDTSDGDRIYTHAEMVKLCDEARQRVAIELIEIADEYQAYIIEDNAPCKLSAFFEKHLSGAE